MPGPFPSHHRFKVLGTGHRHALPEGWQSLTYEELLRARAGSRTMFLTRLGGGAFGNDPDRIHAAMRRALRLVQHFALDVRLVSREAVPAPLRALAAQFA